MFVEKISQLLVSVISPGRNAFPLPPIESLVSFLFQTARPLLLRPLYVTFFLCHVGLSYFSCRRFYEGAQSQTH
jgi:hypothetical protein